MLFMISQSLKWHLQIASVLQPTVQNIEALSKMTKKKQQILQFKKVEPANVRHVC